MNEDLDTGCRKGCYGVATTGHAEDAPSLGQGRDGAGHGVGAGSNGLVSNAPSGPFQTTVLQPWSFSVMYSTVAGPISRIMLSDGT